MLSLLYFLDFSFKSYNVSAVKPSYDYRTLQLYAKRRLDIFKWTDELDAINKKREIVLAWQF